MPAAPRRILLRAASSTQPFMLLSNIALMIAILAIIGSVVSPQWARANVSNPPLDTDTQNVATEFWGKILTHCGTDYYYGGSDLEIHIQGTETGAARANKGLTDYRDVEFEGKALSISAADSLAGVTREAEIIMAPHQWRERTPGQNSWQDWITVSEMRANQQKALAQVLTEAPQHFGSEGLMVIGIWQVKRAWYYVLPSAIDPLRQKIPVDDIHPHPIDCSSLKNGGAGVEPPLPPRSGELAAARDLTAMASNLPAACAIPKGTHVWIQSDDPKTGKTRVRIMPEGDWSKNKCPTTYIDVNRRDVEPISPSAPAKKPGT